MAQLRHRKDQDSMKTPAPSNGSTGNGSTGNGSTSNGSSNGSSNDSSNDSSPSGLSFFHQLDEWQQDNHFIRSGYVKGTGSYKKSFGSLLYVHNETGNIYSHLVPSSVLMASLIYYVKYHLPVYGDHLPAWEWLNFIQFGLAANFCLTMSSVFHCLKSHSHKVSKFGNQLDYFGIIILITCSLISIVMFAYVKDTFWKYTFCVVFLGLGSVCTVFTLDPKFSSAKYRPIRSTMFILFGLSGTLPIFVAFKKYGVAVTSEMAGLNWLILEGFFYILGAVLYAMRVPERFTHLDQDETSLLQKPHIGKFDIWGHSHQIFHVFVVIAAFCHWKALVACYLYMHSVTLVV